MRRGCYQTPYVDTGLACTTCRSYAACLFAYPHAKSNGGSVHEKTRTILLAEFAKHTLDELRERQFSSPYLKIGVRFTKDEVKLGELGKLLKQRGMQDGITWELAIWNVLSLLDLVIIDKHNKTARKLWGD